LAGKCEKPNSFAYDKDIAKSIVAKAADAGVFEKSSLWITVQGRSVFIEGCVRDMNQAKRLDSFARAIPDVQQVGTLVYTTPRASPPYKIFRNP